jgi:hypothetical protein
MHVAGDVDHGIGQAAALGQPVAAVLQRLHKTRPVMALPPCFGDRLDALLLGDAAAFLLLFLLVVGIGGLGGETLRPRRLLHAFRYRAAQLPREGARDRQALQSVEANRDRPAAPGIDAAPHHMAMLARHAVLVLLLVKDDSAALLGQAEALLVAADQLEIPLFRQPALPLVRADRHAVEIFLAVGRLRLRVPLAEGAGEIAGDAAAHVGDLDALIVVRVEQMGRQLCAPAALACLADHVARRLAFRLRASISQWPGSLQDALPIIPRRVKSTISCWTKNT